MINYLSNKPLISILLSMIGIGLFVAAYVLNPFMTIQRASAVTPNTNCATNEAEVARFVFPFRGLTSDGKQRPVPPATGALGGGGNYFSNWYVAQWLMFDSSRSQTESNHQFPIGPAMWLVCGKNTDPQGNTTRYQERWSLEQVRWATSRGTPEQRGHAFNRTGPNTFSGAKLNIDNSQTVGGDTNNSERDLAFKGKADSAWDPVGLYGLLYDSKDSLNMSRSFFPSKWTVEGTYE